MPDFQDAITVQFNQAIAQNDLKKLEELKRCFRASKKADKPFQAAREWTLLPIKRAASAVESGYAVLRQAGHAQSSRHDMATIGADQPLAGDARQHTERILSAVNSF